jgi:hypothetical protein
MQWRFMLVVAAIGALSVGFVAGQVSAQDNLHNFAFGRNSAALACGEQWPSNQHLDLPGERRADSCDARGAQLDDAGR